MVVARTVGHVHMHGRADCGCVGVPPADECWGQCADDTHIMMLILCAIVVVVCVVVDFIFGDDCVLMISVVVFCFWDNTGDTHAHA